MGQPVPFLRALHAILATWPLAVIIPARAGDLFRSVAIRDLVPVAEGSGSVVAEKAVDVQSLCLLAIAGATVHGAYEWAGVAAAILVAEWVFVLLVLRFRGLFDRLPMPAKIRGLAAKVTAPLEALVRSPRHLLGVTATSIVAWVNASGIVHVLLMVFRVEVIPFTETLAYWPLAVFAGLLPLTAAGVGTRDAAFLGLVVAGGLPEAAEGGVLAATLGYSIVATFLLALLGLPFGLRLYFRARDTKTPETP